MKVIKVVNKAKKYLDKSGREHCSVNYYLELDNKKWISIRPSFYNETKTLDAVAELVVNG